MVLAVLFVLGEIVSGALKEAGKDLWGWIKMRHARHRAICVLAEATGRQCAAVPEEGLGHGSWATAANQDLPVAYVMRGST